MDKKNDGQGKEKGAKGSQSNVANKQGAPGKGDASGSAGSQDKSKRAPGGDSSREGGEQRRK